MLPAHERFHADEMKAANVDLRLVVNNKLRSLEARAQIAFEHELFESARGSARRVELIDCCHPALFARSSAAPAFFNRPAVSRPSCG